MTLPPAGYRPATYANQAGGSAGGSTLQLTVDARSDQVRELIDQQPLWSRVIVRRADDRCLMVQVPPKTKVDIPRVVIDKLTSLDAITRFWFYVVFVFFFGALSAETNTLTTDVFVIPALVGAIPFIINTYKDFRDDIAAATTQTLRFHMATTWQLNKNALWSSCVDRGSIRRLQGCVSLNEDCVLVEQIPNGGRLKHHLNLDLDTEDEAAWLANLITAWLASDDIRI